MMPNYSGNSRNFVGHSMNSRYSMPDAYSRPVSHKRSLETYCRQDDVLSNLPLAMAYVPWQIWQDIYAAETGLHKGTIFKELDKPFFGKGGCSR